MLPRVDHFFQSIIQWQLQAVVYIWLDSELLVCLNLVPSTVMAAGLYLFPRQVSWYWNQQVL